MNFFLKKVEKVSLPAGFEPRSFQFKVQLSLSLEEPGYPCSFDTWTITNYASGALVAVPVLVQWLARSDCDQKVLGLIQATSEHFKTTCRYKIVWCQHTQECLIKWRETLLMPQAE